MSITLTSNGVAKAMNVYSLVVKLLLQDPFALREVNMLLALQEHNSRLLGLWKEASFVIYLSYDTHVNGLLSQA